MTQESLLTSFEYYQRIYFTQRLYCRMHLLLQMISFKPPASRARSLLKPQRGVVET